MAPLVYIVILNWNDYQSTLACLESLRSGNYQNYKILVLDNGSTNESVQVLTDIAGIELHCNPQNQGFAGGNNRAIELALAAGADYIWLLNNDATVEENCLSRLVETAEQDAQIGLLSPVIYEAGRPGKIQHCGTRYNLTAATIDEAQSIDTANSWQTENPYTMALWGTALLIPRRTIEKIGVLDERLFAYSEDTDYSIRSAKANLKNITVFDAGIQHQGHSGFRKPNYYYYTIRNSFHFWRKYLKTSFYIRVFRWNLDRAIRRITQLAGYHEQLEACYLGVWHGLLGVYGEYQPQRRAPWFVRSWLAKQAQR